MKHPVPDQALKESGAIIGRTGSGKSYAARGIVERILEALRALEASARPIIIDPTGVWWGLRSSADGKHAAFSVVVFGGDHADVPIAETSGTAVAALLAEKNLPAIVDVSEMTSAGRTRFMTAFLEELYNQNRAPLTFIVDEADLFAPQRPGKEQLTMLGRMEQICRRGRVRGFRPWLITQRPASLHKSVLSQANTLIAMQLTAPQDRDAMGDWIEGQADRVEGKRILAELPKLKKGEGFVWAPHHEILQRVKFPAIKTYDSMRTPEDGEALPAVELAAVDLSEIMESLEEAEDEAAESDPAALRKEIRRLEDALEIALQDGGRTASQAELAAEYTRGRADGWEARTTPTEEELDKVWAQGYESGTEHGRATALSEIEPHFYGLKAWVEETSAEFPLGAPQKEARRPSTSQVAKPKHKEAQRVKNAEATRRLARVEAGPGTTMSKAERLILTALAQYPKGRTKIQVAVLAGYTVSGGGFKNAIGSARTKGWMNRDEPMLITPAGLAALGSYDPLPTGQQLLAYWTGQVSKAERQILEALTAVHPSGLNKAQLAGRAGYEADGGGFKNALGRLRTLELVEGYDEIKASEAFFQ